MVALVQLVCISPELFGRLNGLRGVAAPLPTVASLPAEAEASESWRFRRGAVPFVRCVTGRTVKTRVLLGTSRSRLLSLFVSVANDVSDANFRSFRSIILLAQLETGARK